MIKTTTYLLFALLLTGCAANQSTQSENDNEIEIEIAKLRIDKTSKHLDGSVEMITRCSGFVLSEKLVHDFLLHAAHFKEDVPDKYYRALPCSATGSVKINSQKYNWVIRAGGVGEYYNEKERVILICGKNCCDKAPGIC